jgi:hypothetical protein
MIAKNYGSDSNIRDSACWSVTHYDEQQRTRCRAATDATLDPTSEVMLLPHVQVTWIPRLSQPASARVAFAPTFEKEISNWNTGNPRNVGD